MLKATILTVACCSLLGLAQTSHAPSAEREEILKVEDAFRSAKFTKDVTALKRILADEYFGMNQYGRQRDKAGLLELFSSFNLSSLTVGKADVRVAGDIAIVTGSQSEENPAGKEEHLFTRVYVKREGRWLLLSSTQLVPFNP